MGYCCNASAHCNARIAAMPLRIAAMHVLLQCLSALPQYPFQCSYCRNIAAMLMLLAMPFNIAATRIAAILKRIAAMLPLLHHCGNAAIARGIAAMPFGIAATPQYFPDVDKARRHMLLDYPRAMQQTLTFFASGPMPIFCRAHQSFATTL